METIHRNGERIRSFQVELGSLLSPSFFFACCEKSWLKPASVGVSRNRMATKNAQQSVTPPWEQTPERYLKLRNSCDRSYTWDYQTCTPIKLRYDPCSNKWAKGSWYIWRGWKGTPESAKLGRTKPLVKSFKNCLMRVKDEGKKLLALPFLTVLHMLATQLLGQIHLKTIRQQTWEGMML